jgi:hypothetical protein
LPIFFFIAPPLFMARGPVPVPFLQNISITPQEIRFLSRQEILWAFAGYIEFCKIINS